MYYNILSIIMKQWPFSETGLVTCFPPFVTDSENNIFVKTRDFDFSAAFSVALFWPWTWLPPAFQSSLLLEAFLVMILSFSLLMIDVLRHAVSSALNMQRLLITTLSS